MEIEESGMFQQYGSGASTIKTIVMVAILCVAFVLSLAFGASAFGFRGEGEVAPNTEGIGGQLSGCEIPDNYLKVFNDATTGYKVSPALIAAIFYAGEHAKSWPDINGPWAEGQPTSDGTAKGPFQFKDGTWTQYGMGGNVQDINDAAKGAANMFDKNIANGKGDIEHNIKNAIKNYNKSDEYVNTVYDQFQKFEKCLKDTGSSSGDKTTGFIKEKIQTSWYQKKNDTGDPVVSDRGKDPTGVVLHWTAGGSVQGAINAMSGSGSFVHLVIDTDGAVYKILPFTKKVTSGSGSASDFAIGIEIVSIADNSIAKNEQALMGELTESPGSDGVKIDRSAQFTAVINTIKFLQSSYPEIENVKGNGDNLDNGVGVFGHLQTQSKVAPIEKDGKITGYDKSWAGLVKGCRAAKSDPGKRYIRQVWETLGTTGSDCLDS